MGAGVQGLELLLAAHCMQAGFAEARGGRPDLAQASGVPFIERVVLISVLVRGVGGVVLVLVDILLELGAKAVVCANTRNLPIILRQLCGIQIVRLHEAYGSILPERRRPIHTLSNRIRNCFE